MERTAIGTQMQSYLNIVSRRIEMHILIGVPEKSG